MGSWNLQTATFERTKGVAPYPTAGEIEDEHVVEIEEWWQGLEKDVEKLKLREISDYMHEGVESFKVTMSMSTDTI